MVVHHDGEQAFTNEQKVSAPRSQAQSFEGHEARQNLAFARSLEQGGIGESEGLGPSHDVHASGVPRDQSVPSSSSAAAAEAEFESYFLGVDELRDEALKAADLNVDGAVCEEEEDLRKVLEDELGQALEHAAKDPESAAVSIQCAFRRKHAEQEVAKRRALQQLGQNPVVEAEKTERENQRLKEEQKALEELVQFDAYGNAITGPLDPELFSKKTETAKDHAHGRHSHRHHKHSPSTTAKTSLSRTSHSRPSSANHKRLSGSPSSTPSSPQRPSSPPHPLKDAHSRPSSHVHPATLPGQKAPKFNYPINKENVHVHDDFAKNAERIRRLQEEKMEKLRRLHLGLKAKASESKPEPEPESEEEAAARRAASLLQAWMKARLAQRNCALIRMIYSQARQMQLSRESVKARATIESIEEHLTVEPRWKTLKRHILTNVLQASKKVLTMRKFLDATSRRESGKSSDKITIEKPLQRVWDQLDSVSQDLAADDSQDTAPSDKEVSNTCVRRRTLADLEAAREDLMYNVLHGSMKMVTKMRKEKTIKASQQGLVITFELDSEPAKNFGCELLADIGYIITEVPPGLQKSSGGPVVRAGDSVFRVNGSEDIKDIRQCLERCRLDPHFTCTVEVLPCTLKESSMHLEALEAQKQVDAKASVSRDAWEGPWVDSMISRMENELKVSKEEADKLRAVFTFKADEKETEETEEIEETEETEEQGAAVPCTTTRPKLRIFKPITRPLPIWLQAPECYGATLRDVVCELSADKVEDLFSSLMQEFGTDEQIAFERLVLIDEGTGSTSAEFRDGPNVWHSLMRVVERETAHAGSVTWQRIFWRMAHFLLERKEEELRPLAQQWSLPAVAKEWNTRLRLVRETIGWVNQKFDELCRLAENGKDRGRSPTSQLPKQANRYETAFLHSSDLIVRQVTDRPATSTGVLAVGGPAKALRSNVAHIQGAIQTSNAGLVTVKAPARPRPRKAEGVRPGSARSLKSAGLLPFGNWKHDVFLTNMLVKGKCKPRMH